MDDIDIKINCEEIKIISFHLNLDDFKDKKFNSKDKINFKFSLNTEVNMKQDILIMLLQIIYEYENQNICFLKISFKYKVTGLKNIAKVENKDILIPSKIIKKLNANAISTSRGVLFEKTAGTNLEDIYLPLTNLDEFIKKENLAFPG